jgi:oligopeptide/dipeptide ABC transporter ATP-binding protein
MTKELLDIQGLKTYFHAEYGLVNAVDGVDLKIDEGETLGLVGESGSGKTVTALSIMRLISFPGRIIEGKIIFNGENLLDKNENDMTAIRGSKISMIFQDPMTSLNPVLKIGSQVAEVFNTHQHLDRSEIMKKTIEMLEMVGIGDAATRQREYPHQFSGGMRQRVMIAMALSCNPRLLIADEPTTNLDVTIQAQVLELMKELKKKLGTSILLITHDLGVVAEMSDKVAIMYAGKIMEYSDSERVFTMHMHPYTEGLLESIPRLDVHVNRLRVIPGVVPEAVNFPSGCRFHPRCQYAKTICSKEEPQLVEIKPGHAVRCLCLDKIR